MKTQRLSTHLPEIRNDCSKYLPVASMVFNVDGWGCLGMATKTIVTNAAKKIILVLNKHLNMVISLLCN